MAELFHGVADCWLHREHCKWDGSHRAGWRFARRLASWQIRVSFLRLAYTIYLPGRSVKKYCTNDDTQICFPSFPALHRMSPVQRPGQS